MKFRLVEHIDEEELQEQLQEDYQEEQKILSEVRERLSEEGFDEKQKLNGIAFTKDYEKDKLNFHAQFYVDTTTFDYSAYTSTDDDINATNFTVKGNQDTILDAVSKLLYQLKGELMYEQ